MILKKPVLQPAIRALALANEQPDDQEDGEHAAAKQQHRIELRGLLIDDRIARDLELRRILADGR
ncbi:hypothetical protein D3C76_1519760 [compost metagenome]